MACVIPDELGFGPLTRKEFTEVAAEVGGQATGVQTSVVVPNCLKV